MQKYCSTMKRDLEIFLFRSISNSVSSAVVGIYSGMFFEPVVWHIFLNHPIRLQVAAELFRFVIFIQLALIRTVNIDLVFKFEV